MKITFLLPADDLTGGNRVVATHAQGLRARGHEVMVVSNAPPALRAREVARMVRHGEWSRLWQRITPPPGHVGLSGVPHHTLKTARPITASDIPDGDIVVATWWETAVWMAALPPSKGKQVHLIQAYEIWGGEEIRPQVDAALRLPNRKLAISTGLKQEIESALGDLDLRVVPNGVDPVRFSAPPRERNSPPRVGFIYSGHGIKGTDRCLAAIALARRQRPDLQVLAFGTERPVADLPLPSGTAYTLRPEQSRLAALYASCDAWIFPSRLDSFGLPILEAMACRTPVIGVPVGAAPDLLRDGHGFLLAAAPEEALIAAMAEAILTVCNLSASAWRAMSEAVHTRALDWDWRAATALLEQEFSALVTA